MKHDSYAGMLRHIVDTVVVGRDTVRPADDPVTRPSVGFQVFAIGFKEDAHFVTLTASQEGLDEDQKRLLASQDGRRTMASLMESGVPRHGHGFRRSRDCPLCLASDVMES